MSHRTSTSEGKPMSLESTPQLCKVQPPGSALPCSVPQPGRRLPLPGPHGNLTPTGAKSLSFTAAERKDDTGAGAASQPQSPSSPLAKAQKHFLISGAVCSPGRPPLEGGRRLRGPACCALTARRAPGARAADCSCDLAQAAGREHCLHLVSSPGRGSPGPLP